MVRTMATISVRGAVVAAVLAAAMTGVASPPGHAAPPADAAVNQVHHTVTADRQGRPETLWEIADRFLGDANRAGEIFDLNSGRRQPDGGRLADPSDLRVGWQLVLPWDAVGTGLQHGPLKEPAEASQACAWDTDVPAETTWGQTLLAPSRAWSVADGSGVTVAVVGSGVDASAPALAGRVLAGADVAAGTGRGDTGCAGSGTTLAGIVAGDDGARGATFGVAPGARILPVDVGTAAPTPRTAATAVGIAVAAGADVILIGTDVPAADPAVRAAVSNAIGRDVVVVVPPLGPAEAADGLLRVAPIAADRRTAGGYPDDTMDLRAPGVGVAGIGWAGSGAEYAGAFVAGTVALVRSAHPDLRAPDVTRQVLATRADGVVDPVAAVSTPLPAGVGVQAAAAPPSGLRTLSQALLWTAAGLVALLLLAFAFRPTARVLTRVATHRRAIRQARQARARMADDADDPFWEPPTDGLAGADRDEVTAAIAR